MKFNEQQERKRLIIQRRIRKIQEEFDLPELDRPRMVALTRALVRTLGEDGVPDIELRVLHKLTSRGLLD